MARRKGIEFDSRTKDAEISRWHRRNPGREDADLEVHHIFNAQYADKYDVPIEAVKSQQNAVAVEKGFHKEIHQKQTEEDQEEFANWFKSLWARLF